MIIKKLWEHLILQRVINDKDNHFCLRKYNKLF